MWEAFKPEVGEREALGVPAVGTTWHISGFYSPLHLDSQFCVPALPIAGEVMRGLYLQTQVPYDPI